MSLPSQCSRALRHPPRHRCPVFKLRPEGLSEMTFADPAVTDDDDRGMFGEIPIGGQIVHQARLSFGNRSKSN